MDASHGRQNLYPDLSPYDTGCLGLDGLHKMYWEQGGNPCGIPVVFLHGGPGAGIQPLHRRFFDPARYRIVAFDQRGCGRSRPLGELHDNTTDDLIADMERLREHLGVDRWLVFGGSWGSTLGLVYASRFPDRCLGLILRGVFLGSKAEIDWFLNGMGTVFPDAWRRFAEFLPEDERGDLLSAYFMRLTNPNPAIHGPAAVSWCVYENSCSHLLPRMPGAARVKGARHPNPAAIALARIEAHYMKNDCFLPDGHIMDAVGRFRHLPATIVQGRYDMVCPVVTADALSRAWPEADLRIV
ncbi:MAG: prolyl aminopeptidase, partial [Rhodospirillales bacterium]|nr:prolyl aminopeptidase [Rhodospirillales bacterium]